MRPEPASDIGEVRLPDRPRVLVVDDDPALRASLKFAFELDGFEVEDFASAEALEAWQGIADDDCLVIDYRLPGINGLDLLMLLRNRGSRAPAILITSNPTRKLRDQIAQADAVLIEKPLLCDALAATIRSLAAGRRATTN